MAQMMEFDTFIHENRIARFFEESREDKTGFQAILWLSV